MSGGEGYATDTPRRYGSNMATAVFVCASVVSVITIMPQPGIAFAIHYVALASVVAYATGWATSKLRLRKSPRLAVCAAAVLAAWIFYGGWVDRYEERWRSESGTLIVDTLTRSRRLTYRILIGPDKNRFMSEGPMVDSGDPKRHGHWKTTTFDPFCVEHQWFWYGESVSEGRWHTLNK